MSPKTNDTKLDFANENAVIKNENNAITDNDENDNEYNENDISDCEIDKQYLIQIFCNKIRIYGNYELSSGLKNNDIPMNELPRKDLIKILLSFMDILFNNFYFLFLTIKFMANSRNKINRKNLISFIRNDDKAKYYSAVIISMLKNFFFIFMYYLTISSFYPKHSCTNSLYNDEDDKLFWINNEQKYKVEEYYDVTYVLRLIHFILYDWVFIIYNSIFVITFWKIGFNKSLCFIYQIIEYILFISVYILTYYEDDSCVHWEKGEFLVSIDGLSKAKKIIAFIVVDIINYYLK